MRQASRWGCLWLALGWLCFAGCAASGQTVPIDGRWLNADGERVVEIGPCLPGVQVRCGTVIWLQSPTDTDGIPLKDTANADPVLRRRAICGLQVMTGLTERPNGIWNGEIYDIDAGRIRRGELKLESEVLRLNFASEAPDLQAVSDQVWGRTLRLFARCSPR
jgi:uncharacterized protein (DUF2147 family)